MKENNPDERYDLKLIIPVLEEFLDERKVSQINFKATRHRTGHRSSLLDLWLASSPDKCTNVKNIVNLSSEHEGVELKYRAEGIIIKAQFAVVKSTKNLNATNIIEELEKLNMFRDELEMTDPDEIAESLKTKLNTVSKKLVPSWKIQVSKKREFV